MRDDDHDGTGTGPMANGGIVRRQIAPDPETAEHDFLEVVAELENRPIADLPSLYHEVDHVVRTLFEDPPSQKAQMTIAFSYAGYRISIDRSGSIELVEVKDSIEE